jgi:outer membrane PBP1 activator LpoA protein
MSFAAVLRRAMRVAATLAVAGASAFCAAADAPTSTPLRPPELPNPSLVDPSQRSPVVAPPAPVVAPPAPVEPAAVEPPVRGDVDIALVLPLASPVYARAAEAVRDGFLAAAAAAGGAKRSRVIAHADGEVLGAFEVARKLGAAVVVGPLVRDDLRAIVASEGPLPLTLALNQLDDTTTLPTQVYTLTLAIEHDARVIARKMRSDNVYSVAILGGDAPLSRRFATAFAAEWLLAGGGAPQSFAFEQNPDALGVLRRELARSNAQAVLLALDGPTAALARTFAPRLPAYASSLVNETLETAALLDLEGVTFVDLPWIVAPGEPALAKLPRQPWPSLTLERLYALGLDAFRAARAFVSGVPTRLEFTGATGRVMLGAHRQFVREGALAVFRDGRFVAADGAR